MIMEIIKEDIAVNLSDEVLRLKLAEAKDINLAGYETQIDYIISVKGVDYCAKLLGTEVPGADFKHVDTFIDDMFAEGPGEAYARFFFLLHRLPAYQKNQFDKWISQFKLYCTYKDKRYTVTGCSSMGDVWLHSSLNWDETKHSYYEYRVQVTDCSKWSSYKHI